MIIDPSANHLETPAVSPTLSISEAANQRWQAIVVGAGLAGTSAAIGLAQRGVETLLVDRASFPRSKVCGCCLNGAALSTLDQLGLGAEPRRRGVKANTWRIFAGKLQAQRELTNGVAVSRDWLDAYLVREAIKAGVAFVDGASAAVGPVADSWRSVRLNDTAEINARVVIVADGLAGRSLDYSPEFSVETSPASRIGVGANLAAGSFDGQDYEPGVIYMACSKWGYVGVVRLEDGRLDVAAALDRTFVKEQADVPTAVAVILRQCDLSIPAGFCDAHWRGTSALTRKRNTVASDRVFVVGDAAGYIEPFTGEGMAWALQGGFAAAPIAADAALHNRAELSKQWIETHKKIIERRQAVCRWAGVVLNRSWLTSATIRLLSVAPWLAAPIFRRIDAPFHL